MRQADAETLAPLDVVSAFRSRVGAVSFPLETPNARAARAEQKSVMQHLDENLIPRLEQVSTPLIAVVAGSTGAGKSTLVNSVLGEDVTAASVIRPTTRKPVLVHHPEDTAAIAGHPVYGVVEAVASIAQPRGVVIIDAPDLDSISEENRELASRLLDAADMWIFVTTAARYGDALPWERLIQAGERGTSLAVVLNRTSDEAMVTVRRDLTQRLKAEKLGGAPLFVVSDVGPLDGRLDNDQVETLRRWLVTLSSPVRVSAIIRRSMAGTLESLASRGNKLYTAAEEQRQAAMAARRVLESNRETVAMLTREEVESEGLGTHALEPRWQATYRDALAEMVTSSGRFRLRKRGWAKRDDALGQLADEVRQAVEAFFRSIAESIDREISLQWRDGTVTAPLVDGIDFDAREKRRAEIATREFAEWSAFARENVAATIRGATDARRCERVLTALGADGLAAIVSVSALGVSAAQDFLERLLPGDTAELVQLHRRDLASRAVHMIDHERDEYERVLDANSIDANAVNALQQSLAELQEIA